MIESLTHDRSQKIGEAVRRIFQANPNDEDFAPACLRCLANRGYGDFLVQQLKKIPVDEKAIDSLHLSMLQSISTSREKVVREELLEIVKTTQNDAYFMVALEAVDQPYSPEILKSAKRILGGLPKDTDQGSDMLWMFGMHFPKEAPGIYRSFLKPGTVERIETMCWVFADETSLAKEILAPLLKDQRLLKGYSIPMRVCDLAANTISHSIPDREYDFDWSEERRNDAIEQLMEYCRKSQK